MENKFCGKTPDDVLDILEHGNIHERACFIGLKWGEIDGAHHKQWVIDQMLRILAGNAYQEMIDAFNSDPAYSNWDTGIAP